MAQGPEKESRPPVPVVVVEDASRLSLPWRDPEGRSIPTVAVEAVQGEQDPVSQEWRGALRVGMCQGSPRLVLDSAQGMVLPLDVREYVAVGLYTLAQSPATLAILGGLSPSIPAMAVVRSAAVASGPGLTFVTVSTPYIAVTLKAGGPVQVWAIPLPWAPALQTIIAGDQGLTAAIANAAADVYSDNNSALLVRGYGYLFTGTGWDRARTPTTFRTVAATAAGDTALWTPATGKRFRLMGYVISLTANVTLAVADILTVSLVDGASPTAFVHDFYVPATVSVPSGASVVGPVSTIGNGYLSQAVGNTLSVRLSAGLATGRVRVIAWGTEE